METEINKTEVITGLFGLITAKLEDAHEASVAGQARGNACYAWNHALDIEGRLSEITILLNAINLLGR